MAKVTRGFTGRPRPGGDRRLPPGQYDAGGDWPVLTAEPTPAIVTDDWTFAVEGLVERPTTWTWDQIRALPASIYEGPIHCVTTWSRFGMTFTGVSVDLEERQVGRRPHPARTRRARLLGAQRLPRLR
ncbi:MAG TPA: molybdopterin-dependent oxidoreductase [Acidimicrobiales bacterium]|nr:molybdopterin-dependent oxidoreductase [Acidimicrobiales bacterium]